MKPRERQKMPAILLVSTLGWSPKKAPLAEVVRRLTALSTLGD